MAGLAFTSYAVLVQQPLDAAQADIEFFDYLPGGTQPVKVDHGLKFFGWEAVTEPP